MKISSPEPPSSLSAPPAPFSVSFPPEPKRVLASEFPVIVSSFCVPVIFSIPYKLSVYAFEESEISVIKASEYPPTVRVPKLIKSLLSSLTLLL